MTPGMSTDIDLDCDQTEARKTAVTDTELTTRNVQIAALQETRLPDTGSIREEHYTFYWFGKLSCEPRLYGTGFVVLNSLVSYIQTPAAVSERLPSLRLNTKEGNILVISAYAPTLDSDPAIKDSFYSQLENLIRMNE